MNIMIHIWEKEEESDNQCFFIYFFQKLIAPKHLTFIRMYVITC